MSTPTWPRTPYTWQGRTYHHEPAHQAQVDQAYSNLAYAPYRCLYHEDAPRYVDVTWWRAARAWLMQNSIVPSMAPGDTYPPRLAVGVVYLPSGAAMHWGSGDDAAVVEVLR